MFKTMGAVAKLKACSSASRLWLKQETLALAQRRLDELMPEADAGNQVAMERIRVLRAAIELINTFDVR